MDDHEAKENKSLRRLQTRATLYAAPETPITAREFARVMGIRALSTAQVRPRALVQMGASKRAPFGAWLEAMEGGGGQPAPHDDQPSLAELRRRGRSR